MTNYVPFRRTTQYSKSQTLSLATASNSSAELIRYALHGLKQIYRAGYEYKKAGVIVTGIVPAGQIQANLFDGTNREKQDQVASVMDQLNRRYGRNTISFAVQGTPDKRPWQSRFDRRSPAFTTNWDDVPRVDME